MSAMTPTEIGPEEGRRSRDAEVAELVKALWRCANAIQQIERWVPSHEAAAFDEACGSKLTARALLARYDPTGLSIWR